ncbi:hypothetical protein [Nitratireductor indicus]|nr:hypothetical protein [Nitratireductor indicus]SFQ10590.1 hypothetical protein SAMN05216176_101369 [Nitratireductor indicus]
MSVEDRRGRHRLACIEAGLFFGVGLVLVLASGALAVAGVRIFL